MLEIPVESADMRGRLLGAGKEGGEGLEGYEGWEGSGWEEEVGEDFLLGWGHSGGLGDFEWLWIVSVGR